MENQIRALRKERGISQEDLARRCGVSRQTINAIENNKYDPTLALAFALARELGTTVLITEHRLEDIFHAADRCVVMENGRILADDDPKKVGQLLYTQKSDMFTAMPAPVRIFYGAGERGAASPLTVREGRSCMADGKGRRKKAARHPAPPAGIPGGDPGPGPGGKGNLVPLRKGQPGHSQGRQLPGA